MTVDLQHHLVSGSSCIWAGLLTFCETTLTAGHYESYSASSNALWLWQLVLWMLSVTCWLAYFSNCISWSVELKKTAVPKVPLYKLKCFRLLKNEHTNVWMSFIYWTEKCGGFCCGLLGFCFFFTTVAVRIFFLNSCWSLLSHMYKLNQHITWSCNCLLRIWPASCLWSTVERSE